jgi:hypothetical protein
MSKIVLQRILLVAGVLALLVVLIDLAISIAATIPGSTPARVDHVTAGPYQLTVNLYRDPANAGYGLPFAIAPAQTTNGPLAFHVFSLPGKNVDATIIRATFSADPNVRNGIQGAAEITVKGPWALQIQVDGPAGKGVATIPITAAALPATPVWLGWFIGFLPFYVLCVFFVMQMSPDKKTEPTEAKPMPVPEMNGDTLTV